MSLRFEEESYRIRGAVFDVYNHVGPGFGEAIYQECLERELQSRGIPFVSQPELSLMYKGQTIRQHFHPDLVCFDKILVELKAVRELAEEHRLQLRNYLRASKLPLGLLVNFGHHPDVEIERLVY